MMRKNGGWKRNAVLLLMLAMICTVLAGCAGGAETSPENKDRLETGMDEQAEKPQIPEKLERNEAGVPVLRVYQTDEETTEKMDIETYLQGVLAGEMKNDWPMEALKAQAILARTFVLKFCQEKTSRYPDTDISTDIEEAQAYDATGVNERVEQAVAETKGLVLSHEGELPYAWFHAHSGGMTEKAKEGLDYEKEEPGYTKVTQGRESDKAPEENRHWEATFTEEEFIDALRKAGLDGIDSIETLAVGERGDSGRAVTLVINGQSVSAPELRLALGSTKMRSTLLENFRMQDGNVFIAGKGYGHGVGMPQWGAYGMAEEGCTAEEIVTYYFQNVAIEKLW